MFLALGVLRFSAHSDVLVWPHTGAETHLPLGTCGREKSLDPEAQVSETVGRSMSFPSPKPFCLQAYPSLLERLLSLVCFLIHTLNSYGTSSIKPF